MGRITLPNEISLSDKTPRTAIAFDKTSGVKNVPDTARDVLLVGMMLGTGDTLASVPVALLRESDGAARFGAGSMLDIACRAAFKGNPFVKLNAVGVADAGTKATATVTFATTATGNTVCRVRIAWFEVAFDVATGDTASVQGDSFVAALNAVHAKTPLPVSAANASGTVTLTARQGGANGNGIQLRAAYDASVASTVALSGSAMGSAVAGSGSASIAAALAAATGKRYHIVVDLIGDSTSGAAAKSSTDTESDGEHNHGEEFIQAFNGAQSGATTQALALNANRGVMGALNTSESWAVNIAATMGAAMSAKEIATVPYNRMVLNGIAPPPVEKRWTRTETRVLIDNGVTPLVVLPGEVVAIMRAVSMGVKDASGNYDYATLDITKYEGFDFFRDALTLMFDDNYGDARWADQDPDGLLPPDVATPEKVEKDMIDVSYDMEALGIVQGTTALKDQFVAEKVGTNCRFSVPGAIVDGMHEKLGKIVYINRPFA